jgi:hypothetical protein
MRQRQRRTIEKNESTISAQSYSCRTLPFSSPPSHSYSPLQSPPPPSSSPVMQISESQLVLLRAFGNREERNEEGKGEEKKKDGEKGRREWSEVGQESGKWKKRTDRLRKDERGYDSVRRVLKMQLVPHPQPAVSVSWSHVDALPVARRPPSALLTPPSPSSSSSPDSIDSIHSARRRGRRRGRKERRRRGRGSREREWTSRGRGVCRTEGRVKNYTNESV